MNRDIGHTNMMQSDTDFNLTTFKLHTMSIKCIKKTDGHNKKDSLCNNRLRAELG